MNKYPLIRLWSSMVAPFTGGIPSKTRRTQSKESAQTAIIAAKDKRARKNAKRAAVANAQKPGRVEDLPTGATMGDLNMTHPDHFCDDCDGELSVGEYRAAGVCTPCYYSRFKE